MAKHGDVWRSPCGNVILRCGDWQTVLADVERVDAVITDPPYGERTHSGQRHGRREATRNPSQRWITETQELGYECLSAAGVAAFVNGWSGRCDGWVCAMTSHDLVGDYERELETSGRYVFKPLPVVIRGMNVRLAGDGPSSWSVNLVVARPRVPPFSKWGTLPGAYVGSAVNPGARETRVVAGAKPLWAMRAIVRDYSRPGDLICDPCAGGATTLLAAAMEGRRAIGAELDPETFAKAVKRLEKGWTVDMFAGGQRPAKVEQGGLFDGE